MGDQARFDFTGTSEACRGPMNCSAPVTHSAIQYVLRCLAPENIPASGGTMRPIEVVIPKDSLLDPPPDRPVAGGNVETSQRLVDLILTALAPALPDRIPAQSLPVLGWLLATGSIRFGAGVEGHLNLPAPVVAVNHVDLLL